MSEINRIADLLQNLIKSRQTLAVGQSDAAIVPGSRGLFSTSTGLINAIATNFCYGNCLLAKVEGTWYAINPTDNREVVRSNVDRLIQHKMKPTEKPKAWLAIGLDSQFSGFNPDLATEFVISTSRNVRLNAHVYIWIPKVASFDLRIEVSGGTPADYLTNPDYLERFNRGFYEIPRLGWLSGLHTYELTMPNTARFFAVTTDSVNQLTPQRFVPNRFNVGRLVDGNFVRQVSAIDGLEYTVVEVRCTYNPGLFVPTTTIPLTFDLTLTDSGDFDIVRPTVKILIT